MTALKRDLREDFINPRSYRSREDQVGRDFDRAENYLSLVGLVIVILGGIAVSSVTRVFILQKIRSIAVLKCLGARSAQIITVYILQVMALGLAGSLLGVAMARAAVAAIPLALASSTTSSILTEAHYGVTWSAAAQGIGIGVLVSLLFSVVPLLQVRFIKPSLLLRDETVRRRMDWLGIAALLVCRSPWSPSPRGRPRRSRWVSSSASVSRVWPSCSSSPAEGSSRWSRRWRTRGRFRCGTRCCTCRGPATRRGSSCWRSVSARSSSSGSGRCRPASFRSSRFRRPTIRRTCSCSTSSAGRWRACARF